MKILGSQQTLNDIAEVGKSKPSFEVFCVCLYVLICVCVCGTRDTEVGTLRTRDMTFSLGLNFQCQSEHCQTSLYEL